MYDIFQKLLDEREVTAYRVAKETGVGTATLSSWKNGKYTPKPDKMQKLADYFGVSLEYLMTGKETFSTISSYSVHETARHDELDIARDLNNIMKKLKNEENKPLKYNGREIDQDSLRLLEDAINISLRHLMIVNREKYG